MKEFELHINDEYVCKGKHLWWCDFMSCGFINPFTKQIYVPTLTSATLTKHEYGHTLQVDKYGGAIPYLIKVGIPSILSFTFDLKHHKQRWFEVEADNLGGAYDSSKQAKLVYRKE